jgi:hypothetical protein
MRRGLLVAPWKCCRLPLLLLLFVLACAATACGGSAKVASVRKCTFYKGERRPQTCIAKSGIPCEEYRVVHQRRPKECFATVQLWKAQSVGGAGGQSGTGGSPSQAAQQLAAVRGESVGAVQQELDSLSVECTESENKLANEVANSLDILATQDNRVVTAVAFMRDVQRAAKPIAPTRCSQVMAGILTLVGG